MFPPFLISLIVGLIIVGLILWVVQQIPMDAVIARIIRVVIIVCVVLWLLSILLGYANGVTYQYHH
jgi:low temperature requirement protein LtrA